MQPEGFAKERRLQFHFRFPDVDACGTETVAYGLPDVVELHFAAVEEIAVDVRQGGPGKRGEPEGILHGTQVEFRFRRPVCVLDKSLMPGRLWASPVCSL